MSATIPTTVPASARAGDTWKWTYASADYSAADGWSLKFLFKSSAGGFEVDASADGSGWSATVAATTTAAYAAGTYAWQAWVEKGTEKYTLDFGSLVVDPDFRSGTSTAAYDARTHAQTMLDAIEALLEGRATRVQSEYEIAGRRLKFLSMTELMRARNLYKAEVAAEAAAERIRRGTGTGRRIGFRV